jgi:amidohydrolase
MERDEIVRLADQQHAYVVGARRHLHQHPELSFHEQATAAFVAAELRACGLEPVEGVGGGCGVVATLAGGRSGPTLALRAELDALPIDELNALPFRSGTPGVMHACGHDGHTAMLLGTARALASVRDQVPGRVRFLFQPAEELPPGGALGMIEAGCLEGVDAAFALHQNGDADAGTIAVRPPGPAHASGDTFSVTILGRGGHAARPQSAIDAVQVAGNLIAALHQIAGRRVPPREAAVLTIGTIHGGTQENVIAHEVTLTGTVRTLNTVVRETIRQEFEAVTRGVTAAWGAEYRLTYTPGYPVLVNDAALTEVARRAAELAKGAPAALVPVAPSGGMAQDDFARMLERVPGCMVGLGVRTPGSTQVRPAHSAAFLLDEAALPAGVVWYLALVLNFDRLREEDERRSMAHAG